LLDCYTKILKDLIYASSQPYPKAMQQAAPDNESAATAPDMRSDAGGEEQPTTSQIIV
jgi:hypothetical protein